MAIAGIDPKCYILALFVRDDGVRFLLGDDPYEFKDKQLHFQPNTVANDVVEVQGNDGYLLAGQVRRPGTQSFDGYVCNGTNSKAEVEVKRREFLQFFRRSHFYKVIYVFPNGTAIQRKQGFLVDDPTVQELYQQYPEYHVALNFEDVNYYTYEEDDQGQEIYAKEAIVPLAGGGATGGLIWDDYGVVWEEPWSDPVSVSGSEIQIDNEAGARAPIQDLELRGDTEQQGSPTPDYPQAVQTVTGEQTVTITDGQGQSQEYEVNLGKNLFDVSAITENTDATTNGVENHEVTYESRPIRAVTLLKVEPNSSYTLSIGDTSIVNQIYIVGMKSSTLENGHSFGWQTDGAVLRTTAKDQYLLGVINVVNGQGGNIANITNASIQIEKGTTATSFAPYFTPIELCKIGDYQDYIYKSGDDWYLHKETNIRVYSSSDVSLYNHNYTNIQYAELPKPTDSDAYGVYGQKLMYCTHASATGNTGTWDSAQNIGKILSGAVSNKYWIGFPPNTTLDTMQAALDGSVLYYCLATATDTKITDATLVGQLEALGTMRLFIGENNLLVSATGTNLPATLEFSYPTKFAAIGAEWEEGGTKGATIVDVNAIDNTYPVWELRGPAVNPTISVLTTNTTLTYNGTITASQKLVIDMFNKTATLNGTSVIGNVSGDFVYMAPGTNRIAYTAENNDAPDSTIYWQEVVG